MRYELLIKADDSSDNDEVMIMQEHLQARVAFCTLDDILMQITLFCHENEKDFNAKYQIFFDDITIKLNDTLSLIGKNYAS
jgi:hypothetical protein